MKACIMKHQATICQVLSHKCRLIDILQMLHSFVLHKNHKNVFDPTTDIIKMATKISYL